MLNTLSKLSLVLLTITSTTAKAEVTADSNAMIYHGVKARDVLSTYFSLVVANHVQRFKASGKYKKVLVHNSSVAKTNATNFMKNLVTYGNRPEALDLVFVSHGAQAPDGKGGIRGFIWGLTSTSIEKLPKLNSVRLALTNSCYGYYTVKAFTKIAPNSVAIGSTTENYVGKVKADPTIRFLNSWFLGRSAVTSYNNASKWVIGRSVIVGNGNAKLGLTNYGNNNSYQENMNGDWIDESSSSSTTVSSAGFGGTSSWKSEGGR